ncbi:hypothetical protein, partial [Salmonella enterica]
MSAVPMAARVSNKVGL